jgi:ribosomal protein S18 acetylase RimI-like enzyme
LNITLRPATPRDATDIVLLGDMAGAGLPSHLWKLMAGPRQSPLEIGRVRALREEGSFSYRNTHMAEADGAVAGVLVGYPLADPVEIGKLEEMHEIVRPLALLEADAPGHWYVNVLAVYPEFRGRGIGERLLALADELGRATASRGMAIIVAAENAGARRLYERHGYSLASRRPAAVSPGRQDQEWLLLTRSHD